MPVRPSKDKKSEGMSRAARVFVAGREQEYTFASTKPSVPQAARSKKRTHRKTHRKTRTKKLPQLKRRKPASVRSSRNQVKFTERAFPELLTTHPKRLHSPSVTEPKQQRETEVLVLPKLQPEPAVASANPGTLVVMVHAATKLKPSSGSGTDTWNGLDVTDTYCQLSLISTDTTVLQDAAVNDQSKTHVCPDSGSDCVWESELTINVADFDNETLLVQVWDSDEGIQSDQLSVESKMNRRVSIHSPDDLLGFTRISLENLLRQQGASDDGLWLDLTDSAGKSAGRVRLHSEFSGDSEEEYRHLGKASNTCESFLEFFKGLEIRSPAAAEEREFAWDAAGGCNGHCSLTEIDGWIKRKVGTR